MLLLCRTSGCRVAHECAESDGYPAIEESRSQIFPVRVQTGTDALIMPGEQLASIVDTMSDARGSRVASEASTRSFSEITPRSLPVPSTTGTRLVRNYFVVESASTIVSSDRQAWISVAMACDAEMCSGR